MVCNECGPKTVLTSSTNDSAGQRLCLLDGGGTSKWNFQKIIGFDFRKLLWKGLRAERKFTKYVFNIY